jgi:subtilisin family serine protease
MSIGASSDAPGVRDAVKAAYNAGVVLVAAAGNSGNPPGRGNSIEYPARYEEVIAVGATDINDKRARF